ncbi:MAG: NAD-dependent succinate-semialdehyde dehydrogenase [Candidatus Marinimicrobia bacterium]|nr:NAD-dependent succinate-semialdehyde dehydrogenase [Candidatus Neomarinimicrobiota bacterium]
MSITAINPATGELIKEYPELTPDEVQEAINKSNLAFQSWRKVKIYDRAKLMKKAAQILRDKANEYGELMALEMGKPIKEGRAEVEKCAWVCDYYAENAEKFLQHEFISTDASKSFVTFQPLGVILAVMPWNFPFWQVFRFAAPSLMAGNSGILKHASNVPGCALAIEEVFKEAGFPEYVFKSLLIGSRQVNAVIENPHVKAITLTGSTPAGRAVAGKAGEMLKKTVLELGGSDPYIILEDADMEAAVTACVTSRLINAGQSCIAAKRFIVVKSRLPQFEELYYERMKSAKMGDPMDESTDVGPQARHDLRDELHEQVKKSIDMGATCLLGGKIPPGEGAFYPPTILTGVKKGMPAYDEELFGPVAAIIPVNDEEEAIHVANDSIFGLGAAVFTGDETKGERIATEQLEAGCCFVNAFVRSDPRLPFGGIKESGYGRELSHYGIKEFVNVKTVYIG